MRRREPLPRPPHGGRGDRPPEVRYINAMSLAFNPLVAAVSPPPIPEVHRWVQGCEFPPDRPLIDLAQAVPGDPAPPSLTERLAELVRAPETCRYTPVEGLDGLREALATDINAKYGGRVSATNVLITAGCNQAFCLAVMALAGHGDEIVLPVPYYFNHQMWMESVGVRPVHLPFCPSNGGVPSHDDAAHSIGARTKALVLVTPNNPTGAIYPSSDLRGFYDLAKRNSIALVVDETYRDFLSTAGAPHELFRTADWPDALIHLYSFSKVFSLTGYRVGAIVASEDFVEQAAKLMDCVAICAPRLGQEAALFGLKNLGEWRNANAARMHSRLVAFRAALASVPEYQLVSAGAYFAYVRHPFHRSASSEVARGLATRHGLLCLPGSMFGPNQDDFLRFAFANVPEEAMSAVAHRLAASLAGPA